MQSNLTASRKRRLHPSRRRSSRKPRRQHRTNRTTALDALEGRRRAIESVAGLMETRDPEQTRSGVVRKAGALVAEQASQPSELIRVMGERGT